LKEITASKTNTVMVKNSREVKTKKISKNKAKNGVTSNDNGISGDGHHYDNDGGGNNLADIDHITSNNNHAGTIGDTLSDEYTIAGGDNDSTSVVSLLEDDDVYGCTYCNFVVIYCVLGVFFICLVFSINLKCYFLFKINFLSFSLETFSVVSIVPYYTCSP
jgi:hypothetical protein